MNVVCRNCPMGCNLTVKDGNVTGNRCPRGLSYRSAEEKSHFVTRVRIKGAAVGHCPIKSDIPVTEEEKARLQKIISELEIYPPIETGQIVFYNLGESGVSFLAQRRIK